MTQKLLYLDCPFEEHKECQSMGGQWDPELKCLYIRSSMDRESKPSDSIVESSVNVSQSTSAWEDCSIIVLSLSIISSFVIICLRKFVIDYQFSVIVLFLKDAE